MYNKNNRWNSYSYEKDKVRIIIWESREHNKKYKQNTLQYVRMAIIINNERIIKAKRVKKEKTKKKKKELNINSFKD